MFSIFSTTASLGVAPNNNNNNSSSASIHMVWAILVRVSVSHSVVSNENGDQHPIAC